MSDTLVLLKEWALLAPVAVALLAPGLGFAYAFAVRERLSAPWVVVLAVAWTTGAVSLLAILAFFAGWTLGFVRLAMLALVPLSGFVAWRAYRARPLAAGCAGSLRPGSGRGGLAAGAVAALLALLQQPWWFGTPDTYYHLAASRSLLVFDRSVVTDPFFRIGSTAPDSTAGMWNTVHAVVASVLSVDVATMYAALTAVSAGLVIMAFWMMAQEVSGQTRVATFATAVYAVGAWYTDFRAFGYPNRVDIAFAFAAIALLVRLAGDPDRRLVAAAGFTGFTALAVHLASGELALLAAAAICVSVLVLAVTARDASERSSALRSAGAVSASAVLAVVMVAPTLYPRVTALAGTAVLGEESFIWAGEQVLSGWWGRIVTPGGFDFGGPVLFFLTLALSAVMVRALLLDRDRRTAAILGVALIGPVMTALPPFSTVALDFSSYMVARITELLRFVPCLAAAWALGSRGAVARRAATLGGRLLLLAALLLAVPYLVSTYVSDVGPRRRGHLYSIQQSQARDMRKQFGRGAIADIRTEVGDAYPIVATDTEDGYHLMGLVDIAVVATLPTHTPVFISYEERAERRAAMQYFFMPVADPAQRREIMDIYGVEYVFLWKARPYAEEVAGQFAEEPALAPVVDTWAVTFYRVDRDLLTAR